MRWDVVGRIADSSRVRLTAESLCSLGGCMTLSRWLKLPDAFAIGLTLTVMAIGFSAHLLEEAARHPGNPPVLASGGIRGAVGRRRFWIASTAVCLLVAAMPHLDVAELFALAFGTFVFVEAICRLLASEPARPSRRL
jgi:hypothetical protein